MVRCLEDIKAHNDKLQAEYEAAYEQRRKDLYMAIEAYLYENWRETSHAPKCLIYGIVDAVLKLDESK
jgi:hypothetical protein